MSEISIENPKKSTNLNESENLKIPKSENPKNFSHAEGFLDGEEPTIFHYHREERLKSAPKIVREYYHEGFKIPRGFFKVLFIKKGNKFLFFTIIACFLMAIFLSKIGPKKNECEFKNFRATLSAFSFDDLVYAGVKIQNLKKNQESEIMQMEISAHFKAFDSDGTQVETNSTSAIFSGSDFFLRTNFQDYDIMKVECIVFDGESEKTLISSVEKH